VGDVVALAGGRALVQHEADELIFTCTSGGTGRRGGGLLPVVATAAAAQRLHQRARGQAQGNGQLVRHLHPVAPARVVHKALQGQAERGRQGPEHGAADGGGLRAAAGAEDGVQPRQLLLPQGGRERGLQAGRQPALFERGGRRPAAPAAATAAQPHWHRQLREALHPG
jgi:hypothetical protein